MKKSDITKKLNLVNLQIETLEISGELLMKQKMTTSNVLILNDMLNILKSEVNYLEGNKLFHINFEGTGYNTIHAISEEGAFKAASLKYNSEYTKVARVYEMKKS